MADITDPTAIRFSNQSLRVIADKLARAYYACQAVADRWTSLGGGQPAIDIMESDIRAAADRLVELYGECYNIEKVWFVLGGLSLIPNNALDDIIDGSPNDGRPAVTGEDAVRIVDRVVQIQNWLLSATGSFTDVARDTITYINTIYAASGEGDVTLSVADAGNLINRCNELITNYEATSDQNLTYILAYAVNPGI